MKFLYLILIICCTISCKPEISEMIDKKIVEVEETSTPAYDYDLQYVMGKFEPAEHPDFTRVEIEYADREGMYIHKETYDSFKKMHADAQKEGVRFVIRSAARNFSYQKGIWERKWSGTTKIENGKDAAQAYPDPKTRALKILEYSSMPSTSRHHWGTDIDLNNFENEYFESGQGLVEYKWLLKNARKYGFCQVYTPLGEDRPYGYNEEKWHWSYLPIASKLLSLAEEKLKDDMIGGFDGAEVATDIGVVNKYVVGINSACKH